MRNILFIGLGLFAFSIITSPSLLAIYETLFAIVGVYGLLCHRGQVREIVHLKNPTILPLIFLICWIVVANLVNVLFAPAGATATWSVANFHVAKYFLWMLVFIFPCQYFFKTARAKELRLLAMILAVGVLLSFLIGMSRSYLFFDPVQWASEPNRHPRVAGSLGHYVRYGDLSAFFVLFCVWILATLSGKLRRETWPFFAIGIVSLLGVIFAQSQGGVLILCTGAITFGWYYRTRIRNMMAFLLVILLMEVMMLLVVPVLQKQIDASSLNPAFNPALNIELHPADSSPLPAGHSYHVEDSAPASEEWSAIREHIGARYGSLQVRLVQWQAAWILLNRRPLFGIGGNQFAEQSIAIKEEYQMGATDFVSHSHHTFLEMAVSYGWLGLLAYILFLVSWGKQLWQKGDAVSFCILSYLLGATMAGQFEVLQDVHNMHFFVLVFILSQIHIYSRSVSSKFSASSEFSKPQLPPTPANAKRVSR